MTHASLFSGIGGFDLAAEWAGWTNLFNCEIDPFCQRVLKHHFPNATQYTDIRSTDFTLWRGRVDVLTGGFPCQPFSVAGKRKGTEDERHLWPEMLRAIREISPRWIVGENVGGILSWSGGLVFEQVCADLEAAGYEVQPFVLPAAGVGAPHRRDRVWFVAHHADAGTESVSRAKERLRPPGYASYADLNRQGHRTGEQVSRRELARTSDDCPNGTARTTANPHNAGSDASRRETIYHSQEDVEKRRNSLIGAGGHGDEFNTDCKMHRRPSCSTRQRQGQSGRGGGRVGQIPNWDSFPSQSPICGGDDGIPARLDGITFPRWRSESIKAYGNAIVPQVVLQIFETINE